MSQKPELFLDFHGRFIDALGIQMYQKPTAAIAELIANSWDADAVAVDVTLPISLASNAKIVIADSGNGMTLQECQEHYLKVGRNRRNAGADKTPSGRPVLGRKGIGKFAGFGIAKKITVDTISRATGEHTVFEMDLERLRSDEFIEAGRHEIKVLSHEGPNKKRKGSGGTKIILDGLTLGRAQEPNGFAARMARRFLLAANTGSFAVTVNGIALSNVDIGTDVEFDFPTDYKAGERPSDLVIQGREGVEKIGDDEIRWRIRFRKEPIGDEEFRGVAVFCGIKVAQTPFFFELSGGLSGQHGQQYMFGHVRADFIDQLGDDIITTERQRINWEHEGAQALLKWGQERLKELLSIWKARRAEWRQKLIDQKIAPFADRLERLQAGEKKTVTSAIKKIATVSTLEDAEFADLAGAILTAWEQGRLREIIGRIAALDDADAGVILSVMGEAEVLTALHVAEVVKTKLELVRGLRKRVETKELENAIRDYIAKHPWLIEPRLEFFRKETSLNKLLAEVASSIKLDQHPDFSKRVDLLLANGDHLVLLEFMRPGVKLDRDHLDRFTQYVDELRGRILASTGGPFRRITGRLVADELTKSPGNMKAIERLEANDMYAMEWEMLLGRAETEFREYFEIMTDRAPDDARVRDLKPDGSEGKKPKDS
ncbi:MAG: ATP-binding protein [Xanthobacteraceae bacterium]|nr:ATP-binding protein [Xanthobacteraceae bacterium]QYK45626.1 MAG: ATP-binding protein [Xanthobacteraceae bacterium]